MIDKLRSNQLDDTGKLVLRLMLGILMLFHGVAKILHGIDPIQGMLANHGLPGFLANAVYLGEVVAPVLVILGYYARVGAGLILVNMVVAILLAHSGDLLTLTAHGGWRLELQGMYLFTATALLLTGPGRFSINRC
jgi:putative oxidoreductase